MTAFLTATAKQKRYCLDETDDTMAKRNAMAIAAPDTQCSKQVPNKPTTLIMHYTAASLGRTLHIFLGHKANAPVTSHYTISPDGHVIQHASETVTAHHAGVSFWRGVHNLNASSIGIEHVNLGYRQYSEQPDGITVQGDPKHEWYPFDAQQIRASIALCKKIIADHNIEPRNILGHGDVAPGRKVDPGPLFPWKTFAQAGIGAWPDLSKTDPLPCEIDTQTDEERKAWTLTHLNLWGYTVPNATTTPEAIITAFQMHFRPENISGLPDKETVTILSALLQTYGIASRHQCPCQKKQ